MNWKSIVLVLLLIASVVAVAAHLSSPRDIIKQATPSLAPEQRTVLEQSLRDAEQKVEEITDDMSEDERALRHFALGRVHYLLGNYADAKKYFEKAVAIKKNIPLYLEYYNLLATMQDYK